MSLSPRIRTGLIRRVALGLAVAVVAAPTAAASTYGPLGQVLASDGQLSHGLSLAAVNARSAADGYAEGPAPDVFRGGFSPIAPGLPGTNGELSWPETGAGVGIGLAVALGLAALGFGITRRRETLRGA